MRVARQLQLNGKTVDQVQQVLARNNVFTVARQPNNGIVRAAAPRGACGSIGVAHGAVVARALCARPQDSLYASLKFINGIQVLLEVGVPAGAAVATLNVKSRTQGLGGVIQQGLQQLL